MDWYVAAWKKYADFSGRARRKEYWYFGLFNGLVFIVIYLLIGLLGGFNENDAPRATAIPAYVLLALYYLAVIVPSLAVTVRRLHDIDKSGWWIFINFVPAVGGIWFLILMCMDSVPDANQWGPNPKDASPLATAAIA
jgi:uncharacterized membrane protein YhaH (DUF805 family)